VKFNSFTLDSLSPGCSAIVAELNFEGIQKIRMIDLGLVPGAVVKALHRSPAGDPTAYYIMGAVIALRDEDASKITIRPIEQTSQSLIAQTAQPPTEPTNGNSSGKAPGCEVIT